MSARYYDTARREVLPWLPQRVTRMLDVGCGAGATTAAVRQVRAVEWAGGIEYVDEVAAQAEASLDRVWHGDAALAPLEAEIAPGSLDLVLCLDVLEHMSDPWTMVGRLSALVAPGGRLILSVPNVRHWKFLWRLFALGDFAYRDAGLLDRTHLRFFVRRTAVELATCGGLTLVAAVSAQGWRFPEPRWWFARASAGRLDEIIAKQWLVTAEKPSLEARLA
jgi:2-polyprenyl-3-methyl-5-hydroxy-6-metoxy-1,4-benzoquinol methylase